MALSSRDTARHRARRVRRRLKSLAGGRPRLSVFRSSKNIYAQILDDRAGVTVAAASPLEAGQDRKGSDKWAAGRVWALAAQRWGEVVFRINSGQMPPKREPQPKADELGKVADWIASRIKEGEAARMAKRGPVAHYRLSREEYANTIQDLLGVHYDPMVPGALNEDPRWHGFERIRANLSLSPSHVER